MEMAGYLVIITEFSEVLDGINVDYKLVDFFIIRCGLNYRFGWA